MICARRRLREAAGSALQTEQSASASGLPTPSAAGDGIVSNRSHRTQWTGGMGSYVTHRATASIQVLYAIRPTDEVLIRSRFAVGGE
jgi:hypothetical protein